MVRPLATNPSSSSVYVEARSWTGFAGSPVKCDKLNDGVCFPTKSVGSFTVLGTKTDSRMLTSSGKAAASLRRAAQAGG